MKIIIVNGSSTPLYEQIKEAIKENIIDGNLHEDEQLPSVRALSRNLKVSILTVKKAYDELESEGFIITRQGLGSFVVSDNKELKKEEMQKELELHLIEAFKLSKILGIDKEDLLNLFNFIYEEDNYGE